MLGRGGDTRLDPAHSLQSKVHCLIFPSRDPKENVAVSRNSPSYIRHLASTPATRYEYQSISGDADEVDYSEVWRCLRQ